MAALRAEGSKAKNAPKPVSDIRPSGHKGAGAPIMRGDPGRNFWMAKKNKRGRGYGTGKAKGRKGS